MSSPAARTTSLVVATHPSVAAPDAALAELTVHSLVQVLDALEARPWARLAWHMNGHLLDHLARHHEGFLLRLRPLCEAGQIEILGGPFYGGAPALLSEADVRGQIAMAAEFWESFIGAAPRGCLLPDLAWAAELPRLLNDTGIVYGVVSDAQVAHTQAACPPWGKLERGGLSLYALCVDAQLSRSFRADALAACTTHIVAQARALPGHLPLPVLLPGEALGPVDGAPQETVIGRLLDELRAQDVHTALPGDLMSQTQAARPLVLTRDYAPLVGGANRPAAAAQDVPSPAALPSWAAAHIGSWAEFPARFAAVDTMYRRMLRASDRLRHAIEQMEDEGLVESWSGQLATAQRAIFRAQSSEAFGAGRAGGFAEPAVRDAAQSAISAAEENLDALFVQRAAPLSSPVTVTGCVSVGGLLAAEDVDDDVYVQAPEQTVWMCPQRGSIRSIEPTGSRRNILDAWSPAALWQSPAAAGAGGMCDAIVPPEAAPVAQAQWDVVSVREQASLQTEDAEAMGERFALSLICQAHGVANRRISLEKTVSLPARSAGLTVRITARVEGRDGYAGRYQVTVPLRLGPQAATLSVDGQHIEAAGGHAEGVRRISVHGHNGAKAMLSLQDEAAAIGASPWRIDWQPGAQGPGARTDGGVVLTLSRPLGHGFASCVQLTL